MGMENLDTFANAYLLVMAFILGTVLGSFINCWAWRSMHGESVLKGRSHCTSCGHVLKPIDLVPVFSWLSTGGKCRYCGEKVSVRYLITELLLGLSFVAITLTYGLTLETVELCAFTCVLLFLSLTDIDDYLIPNGCIIAALAIRAIYLAIMWVTGKMSGGEVGYYALSAVAVGAVMLLIVLAADHILGRESMGGGDLKLYMVAAFYFGWQQMLFLIFVSCILGLASTMLFARRPSEEGGPEGVSKPFPFGPSIAAACVITMLCGKQVVSWYLGLFM